MSAETETPDIDLDVDRGESLPDDGVCHDEEAVAADLMRVMVISTELPLVGGTPRQRAAAHMREALSSYADVKWLTVDISGAQWDSRARMIAGDVLMTSAQQWRSKQQQKRLFLQLPVTDAKSPVTAPEVEVAMNEEAAVLGWLNRRRIKRIKRHATLSGADAVLIDNPILMRLASEIHGLTAKLIYLDDGQTDWMQATALRVLNCDVSKWHKVMADEMVLQQQESIYGFDEVWNLQWAGASGDSDKRLVGVMPMIEDDLFFEKSANLVIPATGYSWLDRQVLSMANAFREHLISRGLDLPNFVLIGFPPGLTRTWTDAEVTPAWQRVHTYVGAARCVFMPFLTPQLVPLVEAALAVGTPVVTHQRDARLWRVKELKGILSADETSYNLAMAYALDGDIWGGDEHRAVAAAAAARHQKSRIGDTIAMLLAPDGMEPAKPREQPALHPGRRLPAKTRPTQLIYNSVSGMLMVRLTLTKSSLVDEVRLVNDQGVELIRLAPNPNYPLPYEIFVEGGLVVTEDVLGSGIGVELHDPSGLIEAETIANEDIARIEAEFSVVHLDSTRMKGVFWAKGRPDIKHWTITSSQNDSTIVSRKAEIALNDLGVVVVPFTIPLPAKDLTTSDEFTISYASSDVYHDGRPPVQRSFKPSRRLVSQNIPLAPEIEALKNRHAGQRGWIIGNGPSVRLEDLAAVPKGDVKFCFNRFYMSYDDHPLREDYVVSADTLMIRDFGQDMIDVAAGLPLFCTGYSELVGLSGRFVALSPADTYLPIFSTDASQYVSIGGSSVFIALQMAYYMGIRELVLYGMDYSFTMNLRRDPRFPFPVAFDEGNHFIKSYRDAKPWCPPTWRDISAGFLNARTAFEADRGRIINATRGGRLETFERADFDAIVRP